MNSPNIKPYIFLALLILTACGSPSPAAVTPVAPTQIPTESLGETPTPVFTSTPVPTATSLPTATPDPFAAYTIEGLSNRTYGGGELVVEQLYGENAAFIRYLISYPSDGLQIHGFMNVPLGEGPFPVIIALHGYIDPAIYQTFDYTTPYADALAQAGFWVIHPNLRGYKPSDDGDNLFRTGFAVDVLNLVALVKAGGGQPGVLQNADPNRIGIWGHSMGGGVSIRAITLSPDIQAAVLYGSMNADDRLNYDRIYNVFTQQERGLAEMEVPAEDVARISAVNALDRIQAAVSIHHGDADTVVPLEWSLDLCSRLASLGKTVECHTYPGQPHTFDGNGNALFNQRVIDFFNRTLQ